MATTDSTSVIEKIRAEHESLKFKLAHARNVHDYYHIAQKAAILASELVKISSKPTTSTKEQPAPPKPAAHVTAPAPAPPKREIFQGTFTNVTIGCLPEIWGSDRVKRFLEKLQLVPLKVDKPEGSTQAVVDFETPQLATRATQIIPQHLVLDRHLTVKAGASYSSDDGAQQNLGRKRGREERADGGWKDKKGRFEQKEERTDIRDAVCPWWNRPYAEQLRDKAEIVGTQLERVVREVSRKFAINERPEWATKRSGKRCAPFLGILRSPQLEGYRNKSELTCGKDASGQLMVGYQLGLFKEGYLTIAAPDNCRHTSQPAIAYASVFAAHLRGSQLPVWDKTAGRGFWRLLTVREGRKSTFLPPPGSTSAEQAASPSFAGLDPLKWLVDITGETVEGVPSGMLLSEVKEGEPQAPWPEEVLLMVQVDPNSAPDKDVMRSELEALEARIRERESKEGWPRSCLALQVHVGVSNAAPADAPILPFPSEEGKAEFQPAIHDALCELKFRISPTAFFQVNSPTACLLYRLAGQWAGVSSNTLLLDICCGTGTIGLTLASSVAKVIGIDIVESAIEDARANAALNGITNCEFVAGKAEEVLKRVLSQQASQYSDIVAILDPPRAGLHKTVLRNLLNQPQIKNVVYVSCNPSTLADNLIMLCSPPQLSDAQKHVPFEPVKAVACDLFPHTKHCEAVVMLTRK